MSQPATHSLPIWQAFSFVVTAELSDLRVERRVRQDLEGRIAGIRTSWLPVLEPKLKKIATDCAARLRLKITTVCDEAHKQITGIRIGLGPDDYQALHKSDPTADGFAGTPAGGTYTYLLDQFVHLSATWQGFEQEYQKTSAEIVRLLDNHDKLSAFIDLKVDEQEKTYQDCAGVLAKVRARVTELPEEAVLGESLQPLVEYCTPLLDKTQAVIDLCTGKRLVVRCETLKVGFTDFNADKDLVTGVSWPLYSVCLKAKGDCTDLLACVRPGVFDGLRKSVVVKGRTTGFGDLLKCLGGPGHFALLDLPPADQGKLVERWLELKKDLLQKCPSGSLAEEILPYFKLACTGATVKDGWMAVLGGNWPRIQLPKGCTSSGWMIVNGNKMPGAFSMPSFATDQACMKHCKQELGAAPSLAKMQAYFSELVQACTQAAQTWSQNGRPDMYPVIVKLAVGQWKIVVGSNGDKIVHHIDSGYQNSPWIKKAL